MLSNQMVIFSWYTLSFIYFLPFWKLLILNYTTICINRSTFLRKEMWSTGHYLSCWSTSVFQFNLLLFSQQGCSKNLCYYQSFEKDNTSLCNYIIYVQSRLIGCEISNCLSIALLVLWQMPHLSKRFFQGSKNKKKVRLWELRTCAENYHREICIPFLCLFPPWSAVYITQCQMDCGL